MTLQTFTAQTPNMSVASSYADTTLAAACQAVVSSPQCVATRSFWKPVAMILDLMLHNFVYQNTCIYVFNGLAV